MILIKKWYRFLGISMLFFCLTNSSLGNELEKLLLESFKETCRAGNYVFPKPDFGNCPSEGNTVKSWNQLIETKVIHHPWSEYSRFIPAWEYYYNKRYLNHFQGAPVRKIEIQGRRMYEQDWQFDSGKYFFERLINGDKKVSNLFPLGWKLVQFSDGVYRVIPPKTFKEFLEGYYSGLELYRAKFNKLGIDLGVPIVSVMDEKKTFFIRPGLDQIEAPLEWKPSKETGEDPVNAPFEDFARSVGNRIFPMQPFMFDHDFAHVSDYLTHEEVLTGNVNMMSRLSKGTEPDLRFSSDPNKDYRGYAIGIRSGIFHEELAIPDLARSKLIQFLIRDVFSDPQLQQLETAVPKLKTQDLVHLIARSDLLEGNMDRILTRHGGGMSDPYNLELELNVRSTAEKRVLLAFNSSPFTPSPYFALGGRELFSQLAVDSLYGMAQDMKFLSDLITQGENEIKTWIDRQLGIYDYLDKRDRLLNMFYDRLARVQIALFKGIQLQMSPGDFIEGSNQMCVSRKSKVYQFYSSFAISGTLYHQIFCDERVLEN